jgi:catechol 2,3-dioxygenase-like lactoylglutathione lyase family enzyme
MPEGYEFSGISHITVTVRNIEESLKFYRDMVGLKVLGDMESLHEKEGMNLLHRKPVAKHRQVSLDAGGGPIIALTEYREAAGDGILLDDVGITHFELIVSDLEVFTKRMLALGAKSERPGFFTDPDGIQVQFHGARAG